MRGRARWRALAAVGAAVAFLLSAACGDAPFTTFSAATIAIEDFEVVSETPVDASHVLYALRATCRNEGTPAFGVAVLVRTDAPGSVLSEDQLRCGRLGHGESADSFDTVSVLHETALPFDPAQLEWHAMAWRSTHGGSRVRGDRTEHAYLLDWTHSAPAARRLRATLLNADFDVSDGSSEAEVPADGTYANTDAIQFSHPRTTPFDPDDLAWEITLDLASLAALARTRSVDELGHPLGGVTIDEQGPAGTRALASDTESGFAALGAGPGPYTWRFSKPGHLPSWRRAVLVASSVQAIASPWLARRSSRSVTLSPLSGGRLDDAEHGIAVAFPGGAFASPVAATLTALDGQTLPAPLPLGWSPLHSFWLELDAEPTAAGSAELLPGDVLAPGEVVVLARWDPDAFAWQAAEILAAPGAPPLSLPIPRAGAYALVVPDDGATAPPGAVLDAPLAASTAPPPDLAAADATASVEPAVAPASPIGRLVTGRATLRVHGEAALPSGTEVHATVSERYDLAGGLVHATPRYGASLRAYQRPGDADPTTLHAHFPTRPLLLYGPDELIEARVETSIGASDAFTGTVLGPDGGTSRAPGVTIRAAPGDLGVPTPIEVRELDATAFGTRVGDGEAVLAFELEVAGVADGHPLGAGFDARTPDGFFVLARSIAIAGLHGLEPVERFRSDATGVLASAEPATGPRLPGITRGGSYVLVRVATAQALIDGVARDTSGAPAAGLAVRVEGLPWLTASRPGGAFRLVAPVGSATVIAIDLASGDEGRASVSVAAPGAVVAADVATGPTGPRVVATTPADGAPRVDAVTAIQVVFSEPIAPGTIVGALVLRDAAGIAVPGALALDRRGTVATLLPDQPLANAGHYTLTLSDSIADLGGLLLEGARTFSFTVEAVSPRVAGRATDLLGAGRAGPGLRRHPGTRGRTARNLQLRRRAGLRPGQRGDLVRTRHGGRRRSRGRRRAGQPEHRRHRDGAFEARRLVQELRRGRRGRPPLRGVRERERHARRGSARAPALRRRRGRAVLGRRDPRSRERRRTGAGAARARLDPEQDALPARRALGRRGAGGDRRHAADRRQGARRAALLVGGRRSGRAARHPLPGGGRRSRARARRRSREGRLRARDTRARAPAEPPTRSSTTWTSSRRAAARWSPTRFRSRASSD